MTEHEPGGAGAQEEPPDETSPPASAEPVEDAAPEPPADEPPADEKEPAPGGTTTASSRRRRRNTVAAALIGVLTLLLGFAFAVQVRSTSTDQALSGAREEDLLGILDELNAQQDRLRAQINEQRTALEQLTSSDSQSAAALQEARQRAEAIDILNGSVAAHGPGLQMTIRDPGGAVRVADLLDAVEELRGAGAETMQIDHIRVGVSSAITGDTGSLRLDGETLSSPYQIVVIGSPQSLQTAMNIPGGVVQRIGGRGGSVDITQSQDVVVDALRPLDRPQYAAPQTGGK